jgi:lysophospholipid acyltransferase (LPLAT)-like uncharacterized protein
MMTEASSAPGNSTAPPRKRKSGVVVPHQPRWYQRVFAWLMFIGLRALARTLRFQWIGPNGTLENPPPGAAIFCIWHNRLILCMKAYRYYSRRRETPGMAAMVSASRDGGALAAILERFDVQPVRGSSSRRGHQALLELTTWAERGYDLAITTDGPRGPCYVVSDGVIFLAQLTGLPIIPFSFYAHRKIRLKSWDRFQIPLPFSQCEMSFFGPIHVPRETTEAERELLRKELERTLKHISRD